MTRETPASPDAYPDPLAALRAEIDALDDQMHDLLMRRAQVVATLAASGVKRDAASPLRPGREARILRRLLGRHQGALPGGAVVRLWREVFASSSALQGGFSVAVHAAGPEHLRLAREHFGSGTPLRGHPTAARALAAVSEGEAQVAVLPMPEEGDGPDRLWWTVLDAPRLQIVARLPFWTAPGEAMPEALAVTPGAPDASGHDRSFLRLEMAEDRSRSQIAGALTAAGLPPLTLLQHRAGGVLRALAEVEGVVAGGDPRLVGLPFDRVLPLGFTAVPEQGDQGR